MSELFNLFSEIQLQKATDLLSLLNDDLKPQEKYLPIGVCERKGFEIYACINKDREVLFNILDFEGNIPPGFSVNWRIYQHIKQELQ